MPEDLKLKLIAALPRDLLLDLLDATTARALKAHEIIRDHTDLVGKSARGAEGQVRFRLMEKGFQEVSELYGGIALAGELRSGSELRFYQPFMRFEGSQGGVILGFASMPARKELPNKNQSRSTGVTLNYHLTPRLALDARDPKPGDVFVLFLTARDPAGEGKIAEIAIGIIDANYQSYVFYEALDSFIAGYVLAPVTSPMAEPAIQPNLVKLKTARKPFRPPEAPDDSDEQGTNDKL